MNESITLERHVVLKHIWYVWGVFVYAAFCSSFFHFELGHESVFGLIRQFDIDAEGNLPTFFSFFLMSSNSALFLLIAREKKRMRDRFCFQWKLLGILFGLMAIDEFVSVHEMLIELLRSLLGTSGLLYYAWIIPGVMVVIGVGLYMLKFWMHLANRTKIYFLAGFLVFFGASLGIEAFSGAYVEKYGEMNFHYSYFAILEESLELIGMILVLTGLLDYVEKSGMKFPFRIEVKR